MKKLFDARLSTKKSWLIFYVLVTMISIVIPHVISLNDDDLVLNISLAPVAGETTEFPESEDVLKDLPDEINPDIISSEELESYGIPKSVSEAWVNYRGHIKQFKNKEQVRKVYGMTDSIFSEIEPLLVFQEKSRQKAITKVEHEKPVKKAQTQLFPLDPNVASLDSLMMTGLDERVARTVIKFRSSGADYKSIDDLKKVYNMDENWLEEMGKHLNFPSSTSRYSSSGKKDYQKEERVINDVQLNSATVEDLDRLPGIGPSYAGRIVKYRDMLGGYSSHSQLSEVYGLPDSVIAKIVPHLLLDDQINIQLNINSASLDTLASHPYISYKQANVIIAYRKQHGNYNTIDDLKKVMILSDEWIDKVRAYIEL